MNCSEANELFGDAIDGAIPTGGRNTLWEHLRVCLPCRRAFELETVAKAMVKSRCSHISTPPQVYQSVIASLQNESKAPQSFLAWVQEVFTARRLMPALLGSIAIAVFLVFFNPQAQLPEAESDV